MLMIINAFGFALVLHRPFNQFNFSGLENTIEKQYYDDLSMIWAKLFKQLLEILLTTIELAMSSRDMHATVYCRVFNLLMANHTYFYRIYIFQVSENLYPLVWIVSSGQNKRLNSSKNRVCLKNLGDDRRWKCNQ